MPSIIKPNIEHKIFNPYHVGVSLKFEQISPTNFVLFALKNIRSFINSVDSLLSTLNYLLNT